MLEIVVIAGVTVVKWLVYTGLLWVMIKLQKLNYNLLGLLGSSALATLLNFIPVFGCYIGWAALILCLWKVTKAEIAPDVLFTVGVAGAIMFCLNLWAFGALMGNLRPDLTASDDEEEPALVEEASPALNPIAKASNILVSARERGGESVAPPPTNSQVSAATPQPTPAAPPPSSTEPGRSATQYGIFLKGVMLNAKQPSAIIRVGNKNYTLQPGDATSIPLGKGKASLQCNSIDSAGVALSLNNTQALLLRVY